MSKRSSSFIIIFLIYAISITIGILVFQGLPELSLWLRVMIANLTSTLVIWIFSLILKNASLYDPYWSVIPPVILILVGIHLKIELTLPIYLMYSGMIIWGVRLTYNWASLWTGFDHIDWRYLKIKEKAPKIYFLTNLVAIQLFPTFIVLIQLFATIIFIQQSPVFNWIILLGAVLMICAATIQLFSDEQMKKFKERTQGQKLCIEEGLWKYSRHPNYFGEVTFWWGLYIIYLGYIKTLDFYILAPMFMTALFVFISIPWMEKKILMNRPEYEGYQKRVSMLIPFFRKEEPEMHVHES